MNLAEKIRHLREVEGELRGLNRPMTQIEVVQAMNEELGEQISQAYLSQLESGKRLHLTAKSRDLLARFFKVHPGYLVSDPPDYNTDLQTEIAGSNAERLHIWLRANAAEWTSEPDLQELLDLLALSTDPRRYIRLFRRLMSLSLLELEAVVDAVTTSDNTTGVD
ncbi:MAG: helix-turn-helix transcriptional regulator [Ktedonobacteraceae bacterium]|nr:helix-turn-helix transcriptional regulator [Ktedonobacteraceae bacterium]